MKPTNAYQRLGVSYVRYIAYLLHVSATLVVTLREVSTRQQILQAFLNKCTFFFTVEPCVLILPSFITN